MVAGGGEWWSSNHDLGLEDEGKGEGRKGGADLILLSRRLPPLATPPGKA